MKFFTTLMHCLQEKQDSAVLPTEGLTVHTTLFIRLIGLTILMRQICEAKQEDTPVGATGHIMNQGLPRLVS